MTNDNDTQPESTPDTEAAPSGTQDVKADSVSITNEAPEAAPAESESDEK